MKFLITGLAFLILTSGCARTYYQLYTTSSKDLKLVNSKLVNTDENLQIVYNLWGNEGNGDYFIFNNTAKEMFIDLGRSHLVIDSIAYSYYPTIQYERTPKFTSNDIAVNINMGNPLNSTILSHQLSRIIILPPKSGKTINGYHLNSSFIKYCDQEPFPKHSETQTFTFDKETTPLLVRNVLCYSFSEDFKDFKMMDDEFWVSELTNYPDLEFMKIVRIVACGKNTDIHKEVYTYESPVKFYLRYNNGGIGF